MSPKSGGVGEPRSSAEPAEVDASINISVNSGISPMNILSSAGNDGDGSKPNRDTDSTINSIKQKTNNRDEERKSKSS